MILFVFIPLRGSEFGKPLATQCNRSTCPSFRPLAGNLIWKGSRPPCLYCHQRRFRPLAGKLVWKELRRFGELAKQWRVSVPLRGSWFVVKPDPKCLSFPSPCGEVGLERVHFWKPYVARVSDPHFDTTFFILNKIMKLSIIDVF